MMLYLYPRNQVDFSWNGEPIRHSYDEHVIRDEAWQLNFKVLLDDNEEYKTIRKGMVVKAWTPDGEQAFRVWDIIKGKDYIEFEALHILYDLDTKLTNPVYVNNGGLNGALTQFKNGLPSEMGPFEFSTGITRLRTYNTENTDQAKDKYNALDVFLDGAHSIVGTWEAELLINNWDIRLVESLGSRTGALLYEQKNIRDFEDEESNKNLITRIYAQSTYTPERGTDDDSEPEEVHISVVVDSLLIDAYEQVHEAIYVNNDIRTASELEQWARRKFTYEKVDLPRRSIKVDTNIIDGTTINYGDYVVLKYLSHDVDEEIRCVGYDVNPVAQEFYNIILGSSVQTVSGAVSGAIQDFTEDQLSNEMRKVAERVTKIIVSANGFNRTAFGPEPVPNPIEGDIWYDFEFDTPNEVTMKIYRDGRWVIVMDDFMGERIKADISELIRRANELDGEVSKLSDEVDDKTSQALADAQQWALDKDEELRQLLNGLINDAQSTADTARNEASQALIDAKSHAESEDAKLRNELNISIGNAQGDATQALIDASKAYTDAVAEADRLAEIRDDNITIEAGQIISGVIDSGRINASEVVTNGLTANVIKSTHIESSNALIDKLFATEALIDRLTSKQAFITDIQAMEISASRITSGTINSARINASEILTNGLTANVIKSTHIDVNNALIDKLFATEALIDRLTTKQAFITDIKAIDIDASRITSGQIETNRLKVTEIVSQGISANAEAITQLVIADDAFKLSVGNEASLRLSQDLFQVKTLTQYRGENNYLDNTKYTPNSSIGDNDGTTTTIKSKSENISIQIIDGSTMFVVYGIQSGTSGDVVFKLNTATTQKLFVKARGFGRVRFKLGENGTQSVDYRFASSVETSPVGIEVPAPTASTDELIMTVYEDAYIYDKSFMASTLDSPYRDSRDNRTTAEINQIAGKTTIRNDLIHLDGDVIMDKAFITDLMVENLQAHHVQATMGIFGNIVANYIDVNQITGNKMTFIEGAFIGDDGDILINGDSIKVDSGSRWDLDIDYRGLSINSRNDLGTIAILQGYNVSGVEKGMALIAESGFEVSLGRRVSGNVFNSVITIPGGSTNRVNLNGGLYDGSSVHGILIAQGSISGTTGARIISLGSSNIQIGGASQTVWLHSRNGSYYSVSWIVDQILSLL